MSDGNRDGESIMIDAGWWSDSNIRIPLQRAFLRMLESEGHQQYIDFSGALDLTFAFCEFVGPLGSERQIRPTRMNQIATAFEHDKRREK
jgi:hypothetical protein